MATPSIHVARVATATDGRRFQMHVHGMPLRLTWMEAKDLYAQLGLALADDDRRIDEAVDEFKDSPAYLYPGDSPW